MPTFEFSDGFDAVAWFMDHPRAIDGDDYADFYDEDEVEDDSEYAYAGAEDAAMEYAWGDC